MFEIKNLSTLILAGACLTFLTACGSMSVETVDDPTDSDADLTEVGDEVVDQVVDDSPLIDAEPVLDLALDGIECTHCGAGDISDRWNIGAGETAAVCAGSVITMATRQFVTIEGTLILAGTPDEPIVFKSADGEAADWRGMVVTDGATLDLRNVRISDAVLALHAEPGSVLIAQGLVLENSSNTILIESDARIDASTFHALGEDQEALSQPFKINEASPVITNSMLDNGNPFHDQITIVGYSSSPAFDHMEVMDSHCGVHMQEGTGIILTNSVIHGVSYGVMAGAAIGSRVEGNVFYDNVNDVGLCYGEDAPSLDGNFFGEDGAAFDPACEEKITVNPTADVEPENAGPQS